MKPIWTQINRDIFSYRMGGNTVADYLWFVGLLAAALLVAKPLTRAFARLGSMITDRLTGQQQGSLFRSMIMIPLRRLLQCVLLYAAANRLNAPFNMVLIHRNYKKQIVDIRIMDVIHHVFLFFFILFLGLLLSRIIDFLFRLRFEKAVGEGKSEQQQIVPLLREVIKLLLWATCFFAMMGTVFHVNVPALITGLGIGGVAIALAGKETVENLFASFTILVDKPFSMRDVVRLGNFEGTVEKIGFRSSRLRSADGSMYIIPNKKLIDDNLENLTRRDVRRVRVPVMVRYGMSEDSMRLMMGELREILKSTPGVRRPVEVSVENFGENTIQLMVSYYVGHPLPSGELARIKQEAGVRIFALVGRFTWSPPLPVPPQTPPAPDAGSDQSSSTVNP